MIKIALLRFEKVVERHHEKSKDIKEKRSQMQFQKRHQQTQ